MADTAKTILLVEDQAIIAMATTHMLRSNGYAVITAYDGESAVRTATADNTVDLVLMDIDLGPGMDGTQAAALILNNRDIPVVFMSSHSEPEIVERTDRITSYGYIVKNSPATVLLASLRMAFRLYEARVAVIEREEELEAALAERTRAEQAARLLNDNLAAVNEELRATEEDLRQSEQRFRLLFERMLHAFALHEVVYDAAGSVADYRFIEVNPAFERMLGVERGALVGHTVLELFPDTEPYWVRRYGQVATTGKALELEDYSQHFGRYFHVVAYSPKRGQFATVFTDVTETRRSQEALAEALAEKERLVAELHAALSGSSANA